MTRVCLVLIASLLPAAVSAQAGAPLVEPLRLSAGGDLQIAQACASGTPLIVLGKDKLTLRASGRDASWRVRLPATLKADVYSVGWSCGAQLADDPTHLAVIEVLPPVPRVTAVMNYKRDARISAIAAQKRQPKDARDQLKDVLTIKVENLLAWRQLSEHATTPLHLYLAGTELKSVRVEPSPRDTGDGPEVSAFRVVLEVDDKDPDNRKAWVQALNGALVSESRTVNLTVGPSGMPFPSDVTIALDVFPSYTWLVAVLLGALTILLIRLGARSHLLRDVNGAVTPPYSLAKHQMAVWFVVVVGAYLYVWLITGTFSAISTTALTLIGISGATGLIAVTLDANKREDATKARTALTAERDALISTLSGPGGLKAQLSATAAGAPESQQLLAAVGEKQNRLNEVNGILARPLPVAAQSRRWYLDLLSDENGISFHRLQMATWTLVLIAVFVRAVITDVLMPDFDPTLLGLLGISSSTYLGFKLPEHK